MTLHLSHIPLTLALTFMIFLYIAGLVPEWFPGPFLTQCLLVAVDDAATGEVIGTELHNYLVFR